MKSSKGIKEVQRCLGELGITFETEKTFEGLKFKRSLRIDIYFTCNSRNYAIEYDGKDHFTPRHKTNNCKKQCKLQCQRDRTKDTFCLHNNINLLRIAYTKDRYIQNIVEAFVKNKQSQTFAWYADKKIYSKKRCKFTSETTVNKVVLGVTTVVTPSLPYRLLSAVASAVSSVASFAWRKVW